MDSTLNLPPFDASIKTMGGQQKIFDIIRQKYVMLTPEEWVRQHFIHFLVEHKGYPTGLLAVEQKVIINKMSQRVDIVAYDRKGKPLLVVECKAWSVELTHETIRQAARYNLGLQAQYLVITNGKKHYGCRLDTHDTGFTMLQEIPDFKDITKG